MPDVIDVIVKTPVKQPAINATAFWFQGINIIAPSPTGKVNAMVRAIPYDPNSGLMVGTPGTNFAISDLLGAALRDPATGPAIGAAFTALIAALSAVMVQRGLAADPSVSSSSSSLSSESSDSSES